MGQRSNNGVDIGLKNNVVVLRRQIELVQVQHGQLKAFLMR